MDDDAIERLKRIPKGILVCPDSGKALEIHGREIVCPETGRTFPLRDGIPALLPEKFTFTKELLDEDEFYEGDAKPATFSRSHEMAHQNARQPILEGCARTGITTGDWVVTIGAGAGGRDLGMLQQCTRNIIAVDVSPTAVRSFIESQPFACILATALHLPIADDSLDGILMSGVLHHVAGYDRMEPYLSEAYRILRPGGAFITLEPNLLYPTALPMAALDIVGQKIKPGWRHHVPHERPLLPGRLHRALTQCGFTKVDLLGTSYVHNKLPWFLAGFIDTTTSSLAKMPFFKLFGYWIGCIGIKPPTDG